MQRHTVKSITSTAMGMFALAIVGAADLNAAEIFLPSDANLVNRFETTGGIALPKGRYGLANKPSELVTGAIERRAWRIDDVADALSFYEAVRDSLTAQELEIAFECATQQCGGFDFRYGIETAPPPSFQIDVGEFYYADLRNDDETLTLLVGPVDGDIYVQILTVTPIEGLETPELVPVEDDATVDADFAVAQPNDQRVIIDVEFEVGSSSFSSINADQLRDVAATLAADPSLTAYVVGHSDQSGGLGVNQRITLARANSVRSELIGNYGVSSGQLIAQGIAFLAPIADNTNEEGRAANRRVEIVYLRN